VRKGGHGRHDSAQLSRLRVCTLSSIGKSPSQIRDDRTGIKQPLDIARRVGNLQARHFGLANALYQIRTILLVLLRVPAFNIEGQAAHFLSDFDAKRTGRELVQGEIAALLINLRLVRRHSNNALWATDHLPKQHDRTEQHPQRFKKKLDQNFIPIAAVVEDVCELRLNISAALARRDALSPPFRPLLLRPIFQPERLHPRKLDGVDGHQPRTAG